MAKSDFTDFGKINIPKNKKTSLVNNLFGEVSDKYDLMNDLMSLGIHRLWKEQFLDWMAPRETCYPQGKKKLQIKNLINA